ncbi:MAG: GNAT family N-acetyltransferase, partial [Rhodospirillaceae bacterium]
MSAFTPITAGNQIIRLAESDAEIEAAQRLRYRVFYEKMGAHPLPRTMAEKCDINEFDDACDHLVVLDLAQGGRPTVVGT